MGNARNKLDVRLVQQGAWAMAKETMPLAAGYLKATAHDDPRLLEGTDIRIENFDGSATLPYMAQCLFGSGVPDVLAFSVLGWSYRAFGELAQTFKQLNPRGTVIWGGNHVAHQAERVFRSFPAVDVVVNAEGEAVFAQLLTLILDGAWALDNLATVPSVSFCRTDGSVETTVTSAKLDDLGCLPSPFLTGAIPLENDDGAFRYDAALMETNRGCPYRCAFCYWGGAVGERIREFPRERLRAEVELLAAHKVENLILCDANFGMRKADEEFVDIVLAIREKTGFPVSLESSWAKNKSQTFYSIVEKLHDAGMSSSFTLALQTLDDGALRPMRRQNMQLNEWGNLVRWLNDRELPCYAELIWGAPGETFESFLKGYDSLSAEVQQIATYPLLLLPNTSYERDREEHGFVTIRGSTDDFEYILANRTISPSDNLRMQPFLLWARCLAESLFFRHVWRAITAVTGMSQSAALLDFDDHVLTSEDDVGRALRPRPLAMVDAPLVGSTLHLLYEHPDVDRLVDGWCRRLMARAPDLDGAELLAQVFEYDRITRPIYAVDGVGGPEGVREEGDSYVREGINLSPELMGFLSKGAVASGLTIDIRSKKGFVNCIDSHELARQYLGQPTAAGIQAGNP